MTSTLPHAGPMSVWVFSSCRYSPPYYF